MTTVTAAEVEALALRIAAAYYDKGEQDVSVGELLTALDAIAKTLRGWEAAQRSIDEALNSGDGTYKP